MVIEACNSSYPEDLQFRRSAFLPYKSSVTFLTNLQRGNTKNGTSKEYQKELSIFQLSAKGDLSASDIERAKNLDVFDEEEEGLTPLMWACAYGQHHTVAALLEAGADVNLDNSEGQTALHFASKYGFTEIIKTLLAFGANVNSLDKRGSSAAILATIGNHPQTVDILLSSSANLGCRNTFHDTPHHVALRMGHIEVQQIIENHMRRQLSFKMGINNQPN